MKQTRTIISTALLPLIEQDDAGDTSSEVEFRTIVISEHLHGERLDRALAEAVPEFSRSYLQQLIASDLVSVNALQASKPSGRMKAGDSVVIELRPTPQSQAFKPEEIPLNVVYEDAHLMVINKPAGLVVHPAPGNWSGTLLNALLGYDDAFSLLPRAGIVHRLDKDTSGLMMVARSRRVMDLLIQSIAARQVSRQYLALGHNAWKGAPTVTVDSPIGRDPRNRLRMAIVDIERVAGKLAQTDVELLGSAATGCFVRCTLHTGRTHQIRVHMASLGHPLVGDLVYGGGCAQGMNRQALHAFRLAFLHPVSAASMVFEAPLTADFTNLLEAWGLGYNPLTGMSVS